MGCGGSKKPKASLNSGRTGQSGEPEKKRPSYSRQDGPTKARSCDDAKNDTLDKTKRVSVEYAKHHGGDGPFNCKEPKQFYIDEFIERGVNIYIFSLGQKAMDSHGGQLNDGDPTREKSVERIQLVRPNAVSATTRSTSTPDGFLKQADLSGEPNLPPDSPAQSDTRLDAVDSVLTTHRPKWKVAAYIRKRK